MKNNKKKNYTLIYTGIKLVIIILFILITSISFVYYKISKLVINRVDTKVIEVSLLNNDIRGEEVTFKSREEDITLEGIFFPSYVHSNKTLILVHGFHENRLMSGRTEKIVRYLTPKGYNIFAFDLRGHGQSEGNLISFGYYEKYDVLGAIDYVKKRGEEGEKIALLGFSMGAIASIEAAGQDERVDVLIADSSIRDLKLFISKDLDYISNNIDYILENLEAKSYYSISKYLPFKREAIILATKLYGIDISQISPMNTVKKFTEKPLLLIHGKCDKFIPYTNSEEIYKAVKKNKKSEIWITEKAGHNGSLDMYTKEYLEKLEAFLGQNT